MAIGLKKNDNRTSRKSIETSMPKERETIESEMDIGGSSEASGSGLTTSTVPTIKCTSTTALKSVVFGDETVKITGVVLSSDGPKVVGNKKKIDLFKFLVSNEDGMIVRCLAWDKDIPKAVKKVQVGKILCMNGLYANEITNNAYNDGNVPYELLIKEATTIVVKGFKSLERHDAEPTAVTWDEVGEMEYKLIKISGWLTFPIRVTHYKNGEFAYGLGAITDKKTKITVRVADCKDLPDGMEEGSAVIVVGILAWDGTIPVIKVADGHHIKMTNEPVIDEDSMMDVMAPPTKKARRTE